LKGERQDATGDQRDANTGYNIEGLVREDRRAQCDQGRRGTACDRVRLSEIAGRHVRLLEDWLGPPALFRRLNRRVVLTPTGVALLPETGPAVDRLSAATERHQARSGKAPPAVLRVNALATFSLRWLLPRLARFRDRHPEIEVRLVTSTEPVDALSESL
jgi:LysR substrate binding domain